jgi:hypothetical protein
MLGCDVRDANHQFESDKRLNILKSKAKENEMTVTTTEFAAAIQRALPQARVFWEKEPDSFFTESPCALTAPTQIRNLR